MATWREALDNVRAGNVALANNVRFAVGYYMWSSKFFSTPPFILNVDTSGTTPNESVLTFRDGSVFGFGYKGTTSGNFFDLYMFMNLKEYEPIGQTVCGSDYTWISDQGGITSFEWQPPTELPNTINITQYSLAFAIPVDNNGQIIVDEYVMLYIIYPTMGISAIGGVLWNFNYSNNTPWDARGSFGYPEYASHILEFLAGEQAEPEHFPGDPSGSGGGTGWFISENDTIDIPPLPSIQAIDFGFSTLYNPTTAQMQSIAAWLWSDDFDENIKLNFVSPFENIIALSLIPWGLTTVAGILRIGNVDSGIPVARVVNQYDEVNCGSINVLEYWGSFLDYNATYSIWLPYIGFRSLKPDDMVNGTIGVVYHIDILTGCVVAYIWTIKEDGIKHVLYTYSGNMNYNVAFSGANFMSMYNQQLAATTSGINNAVQSIGKALSGDITGAVDLLTGQAQAKRQYETAKPDYGRGGNGSGNAGIFGIRYPYIVQCLPIGQAPDNYMGLNGVPSQIYAKLSTLTGYTEIDRVIVNTLTCTEDEQKQIVALLKEGVIL